MSLVAPDISTRLKPDLIPVVQTIYRDMCNLQPGTRVLILSDARTPNSTVATFHGVASAIGAEVVTMEANIPAGGPTYQPAAKWPSMMSAAALEAQLIVDLAVGYADFVVKAMDAGARVIMPGDGIGGPYLDDMLIRTIRDADIHAIRREADQIARRFTEASHCELRSGDGSSLKIEMGELQGVAGDGFLWDPDVSDWKSNYAILPPAQPGVPIPKGRGNGTVSVDGTVLWHPIYHETPRDPLLLTFEDGRLVDIGGDRYLGGRIRQWLKQLGDEDANAGPNHLNIGINPNALMTQNQEWERVYGSVTCGMGDLTVGSSLFAREQRLSWPYSRVHWDWTVMQATILLDGEPLVRDGVVHTSGAGNQD
jgi:leucyl aminopeptidase (aminopeptidase T)